MKKIIKNVKGITLIALVVTIIILLILATITINLAIGQNGLLGRAKNATNEYQQAKTNESTKLSSIEDIIDDESGIKYPVKLIVTSGSNGIVELPIDATKTYTIDWGDGTVDTAVQEKQHTYAEMNREYTVAISGVQVLDSWKSDYRTKILEVVDWGNTGLTSVSFSHCTSLRKIASPRRKSFENITDFNFCWCNGLTNIPENLFSNCPNITNFNGTFKGCSGLTSIPENLFSNCSNITSFYGTFEECSGLTNIPENLFLNCSNVTDFKRLFLGCTGLTSIPENLFSNCLNVTDFWGTFAICTSLESLAPELWKRVTTNTITYEGTPNGFGCFSGCTNLKNYSTIPEYWKHELPPE